jgi:hypothetical protein
MSMFRMNAEFEGSEYAKKYDPSFDFLGRLEINGNCWLDVLRVPNSSFLTDSTPKSAPHLALTKLQKEVIELKPVEPSKNPTGTGGRELRSSSVIGNGHALHSARIESLLSVIAECFNLLSPQEGVVVAEPLQQLVHYHCFCDGPYCADGSRIYGWRYECVACETDFCSKCFNTHAPACVLNVHRVALLIDLAGPDDPWEVHSIISHRGAKGRSRQYMVKWVGNWANELVSRGTLKPETIFDRCVLT